MHEYIRPVLEFVVFIGIAGGVLYTLYTKTSMGADVKDEINKIKGDKNK